VSLVANRLSDRVCCSTIRAKSQKDTIKGALGRVIGRTLLGAPFVARGAQAVPILLYYFGLIWTQPLTVLTEGPDRRAVSLQNIAKAKPYANRHPRSPNVTLADGRANAPREPAASQRAAIIADAIAGITKLREYSDNGKSVTVRIRSTWSR